MLPTTQHEQALWHKGYLIHAGIDEAGRGCWAGPVVAAAVILPRAVLEYPHVLDRINDSKVLSAAQRHTAYQTITRHATSIGIGVVPPFLIDAYGILPATRLAMMLALLSLSIMPHALLIDAVPLPTIPLPQTVLIHGDSLSLSIAAASIVAKVTRDRLMVAADAVYPSYGFAAHKGYGTAAHRRALQYYGQSPIHRKTFRPVAQCGSDREIYLNRPETHGTIRR